MKMQTGVLVLVLVAVSLTLVSGKSESNVLKAVACDMTCKGLEKDTPECKSACVIDDDDAIKRTTLSKTTVCRCFEASVSLASKCSI